MTAAPVSHYDGLSAVRRDGVLSLDSDRFRLDLGDASETFWPSDLLGRGERQGVASYGLKDRQGWQIRFDQPPPAVIAARLPRASGYGGWIDRLGLVPAMAALAAVSAVVVFGAVEAPAALAPLVPYAWEKRLGDAMVARIGGGGPDARDQVRVRVANIGLVNAVALPGGNIVIFKGLLTKAASSDELAGVLGHELGHVANRDVLQALLRQTGLSVLMGGLDGNASGMLGTVVNASYSREAEARADAHAIAALRTARVAPDDTAGFFARLAKQEGGLGKAAAALGYLSSHPLSASREAAFRRSRVAGTSYAAALSPAEWRALRDICTNHPKAADDDFFQ